MVDQDPYQEQKLKRLRLFIYLVPVVGFFPALWRLYRQQGDRQEQTTSRLAVTLALSWLLGYCLLWTGASQTSEFMTLRLLFANGMLTSAYFLVCFVLMVRLWRRKSLKVPGFSRIAEGVIRKHL